MYQVSNMTPKLITLMTRLLMLDLSQFVAGAMLRRGRRRAMACAEVMAKYSCLPYNSILNLCTASSPISTHSPNTFSLLLGSTISASK